METVSFPKAELDKLKAAMDALVDSAGVTKGIRTKKVDRASLFAKLEKAIRDEITATMTKSAAKNEIREHILDILRNDYNVTLHPLEPHTDYKVAVGGGRWGRFRQLWDSIERWFYFDAPLKAWESTTTIESLVEVVYKYHPRYST